MVTPELVVDFLGQRRLAFVGVSRDPKDFSRLVLRELLTRGYDVVPVHPSATEIEGRPAYARAADIPEPVGGALIMTPPGASGRAVAECLDAGVPRIWLHRGAGPGSVSAEAIQVCQARGVPLVAGQCPLMFLAGGPHHLHALGRMAAGHYPELPARPSLPLRVGLALLHGFVALGAVYGGVGLIRDPSGAALGFPEGTLAGTPFDTFLIPGLVLLLIVGGSSFLAMAAQILGRRGAAALSAAAGLVLTIWMVVQIALLPGLAQIQVVYLGLGLISVGLAVAAFRRAHPLLVVKGPAAA